MLKLMLVIGTIRRQRFQKNRSQPAFSRSYTTPLGTRDDFQLESSSRSLVRFVSAIPFDEVTSAGGSWHIFCQMLQVSMCHLN